MTLPIPIEAQEQTVVVDYCRIKKIPLFRVPNETFTRSWKQKAMNKALGVSSGVPDLFCVPNNTLIAIEMKRIKGSVVSPTQLGWIKILQDAGIPTRICKGADEAITFIEEILKNKGGGKV